VLERLGRGLGKSGPTGQAELLVLYIDDNIFSAFTRKWQSDKVGEFHY